MVALSNIVIVVPCFNEERRLRPEAFFHALLQYPEISFLFVDDGSGDRTAKTLAELSLAEPDRIHSISLTRNQGKAEAVRQGFLEASRRGAEIIGYWDADLATPLKCLGDLLEAMGDPGTLVAIGSRVLLLGKRIERRPLRHYLGRFFATCASLVLGLAVYDTQCGAKLFRRTPDLDACFSQPFRTRWLFDVEILARLKDLNFEENSISQPPGWIEVPLREWRDVDGSKVRTATFFRAPFELARIALRPGQGRKRPGTVASAAKHR